MLHLSAQDTLSGKRVRPPYFRSEEINFDNKRYRVYNNYVTLGGGLAVSTIRTDFQQAAGADFNFHIRRQYFQAGVLLSGYQFFASNHVQAHLCYGYRRETSFSNFALFAGPSFYQGVEGMAGQPEKLYSGMGLYLSLQAVRKLTYDIGGGIELFADLGRQTRWFGRDQALYGARIIVFFSGAYRGPKRNYNPNIRSENPNG